MSFFTKIYGAVEIGPALLLQDLIAPAKGFEMGGILTVSGSILGVDFIADAPGLFRKIVEAEAPGFLVRPEQGQLARRGPIGCGVDGPEAFGVAVNEDRFAKKSLAQRLGIKIPFGTQFTQTIGALDGAR